MKKLAAFFFASVFLTLAAATSALAHVEVSPGEVPAGEAVMLTVSVPTELDVPTTEVRVEIPAGFEVESVDEPSGWRVEEEEESGSVVAVTWTGGEIPVEGSEDFTLETTAPDAAGEYAFPAIQTYEDGTVVEWVGAEDSNEPASIVSVGGASGGSNHESHDHETLPDSGGAGYAILLGGMAAMLLGASALRRRI